MAMIFECVQTAGELPSPYPYSQPAWSPYLFALSSKFSSGKISGWGKRGKLTLTKLLGVPQGLFVAIAAPVLVAALLVLEMAGY